ncbi:hypothetical protein CROQUDRAFT_96008 [Cronartium quercuum f. sp. fusiforme G11]|uniref:Uncharacterized protein n=1 Tax=Cronartium quercuum f. sp. fusiforme G11 TaxID=708437 RepID=A0A9P6NDN4_9BASI|nr:hypothetical protein CROQUDRAFT_96008 [Cronartium quercuum f. sp. fusiforme G11]
MSSSQCWKLDPSLSTTLLALDIVCIQPFAEFLFGQPFVSRSRGSAGDNLLELNVPMALRRHKLAPGSQV